LRRVIIAPARCCLRGAGELAGHDAILLGAVGDRPCRRASWSAACLLKLRFAFDHYVNLRPSRLWPGTASPLANVKPGEIDMLVIREGTEVSMPVAGGVLHKDTPAEIATEESLNTRYGVERVIRDAFRRRGTRERRKVTMVHKSNVLTYAGNLWTRTFAQVAADFPDVKTEYQHVDAAAMFLVSDPQRFDVVVTDTCSATSSPTSPPPSPGGSGWRQRQYQSRSHVPVDVSSRSTVRAGHRRSRRRRPDRGRTLVALLLEQPRTSRRGRSSNRGGRRGSCRPYAGHAAAHRRGRRPLGRRRELISRIVAPPG